MSTKNCPGCLAWSCSWILPQPANALLTWFSHTHTHTHTHTLRQRRRRRERERERKRERERGSFAYTFRLDLRVLFCLCLVCCTAGKRDRQAGTPEFHCLVWLDHSVSLRCCSKRSGIASTGESLCCRSQLRGGVKMVIRALTLHVNAHSSCDRAILRPVRKRQQDRERQPPVALSADNIPRSHRLNILACALSVKTLVCCRWCWLAQKLRVTLHHEGCITSP